MTLDEQVAGEDVPQERVCVFIDGQNLYYRLREDGYATNRWSEGEWSSFLGQLCPAENLVEVYYYNAELPESHPRHEQQLSYLERMDSHPDITVRRGYVRRQGGEMHEKRVDSLIVADMVSLAYENAYDIAILLSGDEDFVPAVEAVQKLGKQVRVVCSEQNLAQELEDAADQYVPLETLALPAKPSGKRGRR